MRKKNLLCLGILFIVGIHCSAQATNEPFPTSSNHIIGVQANALIRQIFNFSSANNPVNNPYLLTYTYLGNKKKWGIDVGIGYTLSNNVKNDGNSKSDIKINDLYFRAGVQRHIPLGNRFSSLVNFHALVDVLNTSTKAEFKGGSQQSLSNSSSSALRYGAGPCVGLRYNVNKRIFVGTEFSYYLKMGKSKGKTTTITTNSSGSTQATTTTNDNDLTEFTLNVPAAIFLSISF